VQVEGGAGLVQYIESFYKFGLGAGAFLAIVMIMWGGFLYITSSGIASQAESGKHAVQMAFLGLVLLFTSYVLLQTINPAVLTLKFPKIDKVTPKGNLPEIPKLPEIPPEKGFVPGFGACVILTDSQGGTLPKPLCIDNVPKELCPPNTAGTTQGLLGKKGWFANTPCNSTFIKNAYGEPLKLSDDLLGRCVAKGICVDGVAKTQCVGTNATCVDAKICSTADGRVWQQGAKCAQASQFNGACWTYSRLSVGDEEEEGWDCDETTLTNCYNSTKTSGTRVSWCNVGSHCPTSRHVPGFSAPACQ